MKATYKLPEIQRTKIKFHRPCKLLLYITVIKVALSVQIQTTCNKCTYTTSNYDIHFVCMFPLLYVQTRLYDHMSCVAQADLHVATE